MVYSGPVYKKTLYLRYRRNCVINECVSVIEAKSQIHIAKDDGGGGMKSKILTK